MVTGAKLHNVLHKRLRMRGTVITRTALHIGSGGSIDVTEPDGPVVRDVYGHPYIPGSSFRGVLRSTIETFLQSVTQASGTWSVGDIFDREYVEAITRDRDQILKSYRLGQLTKKAMAEKIYSKVCTVGTIFGSHFYASRIKIKDMQLLNPEEITPDVRNGVSIDRDKETARNKALYTFECIPAGARFEFELVFDNPDDWEIGLVLAGLNQFNEGYVQLGGKTSRGLGRVQVDIDEVVIKSARHLLLGEPGEIFKVVEKSDEPVLPPDPVLEKAQTAGQFWVDLLETARTVKMIEVQTLYNHLSNKKWNKGRVEVETGIKEGRSIRVLEEATKLGILVTKGTRYYPVEAPPTPAQLPIKNQHPTGPDRSQIEAFIARCMAALQIAIDAEVEEGGKG